MKKSEIDQQWEASSPRFHKMNAFVEKSDQIYIDDKPSINLDERNEFSKVGDEFDNNLNCKLCSNNQWIQGNLWGNKAMITDNGKIIVMFVSVLILMNHIIDATKVIEEYGLKYKNDKFWLANMHKLFGLLFLIDESRNEAIKHFDKALKLFKELKSFQGEAISYYLKSIALKIYDYEDEYNNVDSLKESKKITERAMIYFKYLKHYEGFMKWAKICEKSGNPPNKHTKLNFLGNPNYIPYIEREHKWDFFSLGIEPILTTQFETEIDIEEIRISTMRSHSIGQKVTGLK